VDNKYNVPCALVMRYCILSSKTQILLSWGMTAAKEIAIANDAKILLHDEILRVAGVDRHDVMFNLWLAEQVEFFIEIEHEVLKELGPKTSR